MEFKDKLKELRLKKNITQKDLADAIYCSRSAVAKWENGLGIPSDDSIDALCSFFEVSKEELLGLDVEEKVIKNKTIFKQKGIIVAVSSLFVIAIICIITISIIFVNNKYKAQSYMIIKAPKISLSNNNDYYSRDLYLVNSKIQYDPNPNILYSHVLTEISINDIPKHSKEEEYVIQCDFKVDDIKALYFRYNDDLSFPAPTGTYMNYNSRIHFKKGWYREPEYPINIKDNKFTIEDNPYLNLILIQIYVDDIVYDYYFLYE